MSQERETEQAGAPVEQGEPTDTQLFAAVERAAEVPAPEPQTSGTAAASHDAQGVDSTRPLIAESVEPPSAGEAESAADIFAAHNGSGASASGTTSSASAGLDAIFAEEGAPHSADGAAAAPTTVAPTTVAPTTGAPTTVAPATGAPAASTESNLPPVRDGEIRISADHPMAALYMQSPAVPDMRGNRGAGVLISLLATVAFALVYAGALALWQAPNFPASTFLDDGILPWVLNWGFAAAVGGFFVGLTLLVLIVGRAGWWAYVIGGLLVALLTWVVALGGYAFNAHLAGESLNLHPYTLLVDFGLFFPVIAAAIVGREIAVWFGAWIGARGRKMKRLNAEALEEYEKLLAEAQATQP